MNCKFVNNRFKHTHSGIISRRNILKSLIALSTFPQLISANCLALTDSNQEILIAPTSNHLGQHSFSWLADQHLSSASSHFRGHSAIQHPLLANCILMIGRRPATECLLVNLANNNVQSAFRCDTNSHLFGHACFANNGQWLCTSETDLNTGEGKIVIRDSLSFQVLSELSSYGIGPHEIKLLPASRVGKKILVIANGGILTHPLSGRKKLNLETMSSNLSYLDLDSGELLEQIIVSDNKLSIRHLDTSTTGTVAFAMQMQRAASPHQKLVPLLGKHQLGGDVEYFDQPELILNQMHDYAGSVVIHSNNSLVGVTSPKGNIVAFWNLQNKQFAGYHQFEDVCGLCVSKNKKYFVINSSNGQVRYLDASSLLENREKRISFKNLRWDNHLTVTTN